MAGSIIFSEVKYHHTSRANCFDESHDRISLDQVPTFCDGQILTAWPPYSVLC